MAVASPMPGSWSSRLYEILRPAPHPSAIQFSNSQSRFRHNAGEIWRHALTTSVYYDLAGENDLSTPNIASSPCHTWRRFVRIECLGLSGLLFYEIRLSRSAVDSGSRLHGGEQHGLSLQSVFGDPDNYPDDGMDVDDLLDVVHAKVVYFPTYACTSFVMGQAMAAFFRGRPLFRPRPALDGFSVPMDEPLLRCQFDGYEESDKDLDEVPPIQVVDIESEGGLSLSYSWQVICDDLAVFDEPTLDLDDPHRPLRVRSSLISDDVPYPADSGDADDDDKDDGNTTISTIESIGPSTPPRSDVDEARSILKNCGVSASASILDEDHGLNPPTDPTISMCKITAIGSEHTPKFASDGTLCLSVYDDLASFLDISY